MKKIIKRLPLQTINLIKQRKLSLLQVIARYHSLFNQDHIYSEACFAYGYFVGVPKKDLKRFFPDYEMEIK